MTSIAAGRQRLTFDKTWQTVEWDRAPEYKGSMETTFHGLAGRSVKACDVVGVKRAGGHGPVALVAEFKDFDQTQRPTRGATGDRAPGCK